MTQVISKELSAGGDLAHQSTRTRPSADGLQKLTPANGVPLTWRQPLAITFHGVAASTYGYAICWQSVSEAARQIYERSNPYVRVYGRWRFLTYNCLIMQFVAYSLCLSSHFVPRLRRPRDFFFTTFALPIGMLVVISFWSIWFVAGREYIFPASLEPFYPPWLNHITHTIIAPINLVELISIRKQYSTDKRSLTALAGYTLSYTSFLLYIRWQTGRFVYPFLNKMSAVPVGAFMTGMVVFVICAYKSGKLLHDLVHGISSFKSKFDPRKRRRSQQTSEITLTETRAQRSD